MSGWGCREVPLGDHRGSENQASYVSHGAPLSAAPGFGCTRTGSRNGNVSEPLTRAPPLQDPSLGPGRFLFSFSPTSWPRKCEGPDQPSQGRAEPSRGFWRWVRDLPSVFLSFRQTGTRDTSSCAQVRKRKVACASLPAVRAKAAATPAPAPELRTVRLQDRTPTSHPGGPEGLSWP